jgi:hypothetical protein
LTVFHGLFELLIPRWMQLMRPGKTTSGVERQVADDMVLCERPAGATVHQTKGDAMAAMNAKARMDVRQFAASSPALPLLIVRLTMMPLIQLMESFLKDGSGEQEAEEECAIARGGHASKMRIALAHTGVATRRYFGNVHQMLTSTTGCWEAIPKTLQTAEAKSYAFGCLAKGAGLWFWVSGSHPGLEC